jgi:hypothetical protein
MLRASTAVLLVLALVTPLRQAAAQNPLGGAIVGGAVGALLGAHNGASGSHLAAISASTARLPYRLD